MSNPVMKSFTVDFPPVWLARKIHLTPEIFFLVILSAFAKHGKMLCGSIALVENLLVLLVPQYRKLFVKGRRTNDVPNLSDLYILNMINKYKNQISYAIAPIF